MAKAGLQILQILVPCSYKKSLLKTHGNDTIVEKHHEVPVDGKNLNCLTRQSVRGHFLGNGHY